ncbi:hypothetical protein AAMO2058_000589500 [Amorphochlora amoebiformis]
MERTASVDTVETPSSEVGNLWNIEEVKDTTRRRKLLNDALKVLEDKLEADIRRSRRRRILSPIDASLLKTRAKRSKKRPPILALEPEDGVRQAKRRKVEKKGGGDLATPSTPKIALLTMPPLVRQESRPGLELNGPITLDFITAMMDRFRAHRILGPEVVRRILSDAAEVLKKEPNINRVSIPRGKSMVVVGDLHGQLYDLLHIFKLKGVPSSTNMYLFNGDFVDRGHQSCEVVLTLFAFKILYPTAVFLNRGNHEATDMTEDHGFMRECKEKYDDPDIYEDFSSSFAYLPLATILNKDVFVVHGGIPGYWEKDEDQYPVIPLQWNALQSLEEIEEFERSKYRHNPNETVVEGLLWSDPLEYWENEEVDGEDEKETEEEKESKYWRVNEFDGRFYGLMPNEPRADAGTLFGVDECEKFLRLVGCSLMVRSHEYKDMGWDKLHNNKCLTVFSASCYQGELSNHGAIVIFSPTIVNDSKSEKNTQKTDENPSLDYSILEYIVSIPGENKAKTPNEPSFCLRFRAHRMEDTLLTHLIRRISFSRLPLTHYYKTRHVEGWAHAVNRNTWANGLRKVLHLKIPFLEFQEMLGLPKLGLNNEIGGPIDYVAFLQRFSPILRHLIKASNPELELGKGTKALSTLKTSDKHAERLVEKIEELLHKKSFHLDTIFRYLDSDGDGNVNLREMRTGFLALNGSYGLHITAQEVESLAKACGLLSEESVLTYEKFQDSFAVRCDSLNGVLTSDQARRAARSKHWKDSTILD